MHVIVTADSAHHPTTRLVVDQLRRHHPGADLTVVVTDPLEPPTPLDGVRTVAARALRVAGVRYVDAWLAGGPAFARWAVVPEVARRHGAGAPTLVLPATARVLAPLDDLADAVPSTGVGLVPRRFDPTAAVAAGGWIPDVVVVGAEAEPVLRWWSDAARTAMLDPAADDDLDDPWARFATAGAGVVALADPTIRLSPHSIGDLALSADESGVAVDGRPLRLAQFPAFDVDRPWWYVPDAASDPAVLTSAEPALAQLCREHAADLLAAGPAPTTVAGRLPGIPIGPGLRSLVRHRLAAAEAAGEVLPNPFDPDGVAAFVAWLRDPADAERTGINVAVDALWRDRPDLAAAFPRVRWGDREAFLRWLWVHGLAEGLISTALLPDAPAPPAAPAGPDDGNRPFGVNLVGYHDSDLGLGVAVRRVAAALDAAGIPWANVTYDRTHSRRRGTGRTSTTSAPYRYNLILIAPDQLAFFVDDVGPEFLEGRHNIGLWYWETDVLSPRQQAAIDLVDEIWGATTYLVDVFAAHTTKPVRLVPVPLEFRTIASSADRREALGLDDRFTFLFTFDFFSIVERKNPLGLVAAYRAAFGPHDGCRLVLKSINGDRHVAQAEELRAAIADRPDIELWDRYLDADDRLALVAEVDAYVSLHRSEGLGLTMAEAMAAGTPVVATAYSGNLDFMPPGAALLVDAREVEIGPGSFYPAHGHWAAPDLDHAAELLRRVRDDAGLRSALAEAGPRALRPFTVKRVGATIAERLRELERHR